MKNYIGFSERGWVWDMFEALCYGALADDFQAGFA